MDMYWAQVMLYGGDLNGVVAVYSGSVVSALRLVGSNAINSCPSIITIQEKSCANFTVEPGTTYSVQVARVSGLEGAGSIDVTFGWPAPSNDAFSAARAVTTFPATGTLLGATFEPDEQLQSDGDYAGSVWYRFTAPSRASVSNVR